MKNKAKKNITVSKERLAELKSLNKLITSIYYDLEKILALQPKTCIEKYIPSDLNSRLEYIALKTGQEDINEKISKLNKNFKVLRLNDLIEYDRKLQACFYNNNNVNNTKNSIDAEDKAPSCKIYDRILKNGLNANYVLVEDTSNKINDNGTEYNSVYALSNKEFDILMKELETDDLIIEPNNNHMKKEDPYTYPKSMTPSNNTSKKSYSYDPMDGMEMPVFNIVDRSDNYTNTPVEENYKPGSKEWKLNEFKKYTDEMYQLFKKKNEDYTATDSLGSAFDITYDILGPVAPAVRFLDKTLRYLSLASGKKQLVEDEKIEDTLTDLANYAILTKLKIKEDTLTKK